MVEYVYISVIAVIILIINITDIKELYIPDILTIPGTLASIFYRKLILHGNINYILLECLIAFLFFFIIWLLTGKIGLGDAKFSMFIISVVGVKVWFVSIFISVNIALFILLILLYLKKITNKTRVPFAPFMTAGMVCAMMLNFNGFDFYIKRILGGL